MSNTKREHFSSRLGFILISAGCAIGLGNVYRFPITTGAFGGATFVFIYIAFLLLLGLPVMTMELAVGRASQRSIATSFDVLEKPNSKWHLTKFIGIGGNFILMMFYTVISGWMLMYFIKYLNGSMLNLQGVESLGNEFLSMVSNPVSNIIATYSTIAICFLICSLGLKNGVERITKGMMLALLTLLIGLAIYACTLPKALDGIKFYLVPSLDGIRKYGFLNVMTAAMGQSFFTLSVGIGAIAIFGSYIDKKKRLLGEAITIVSLDTFVAIMAGLIIFPACFTFNGGQTADATSVGASFLFTTLSSIFNSMPGGRIIGTLFFLFMIFAAFSTVIAVFETIISSWLELTNMKRRTISIINAVLLCVLVLPTIFGNSIWSNFTIFGKSIMDLEDFIVSNLLLPFGSFVYVLFCTSRYGWGWNNYLNEVNTGEGLSVPKWLRFYCSYILPLIILVVLIISII